MTQENTSQLNIKKDLFSQTLHALKEKVFKTFVFIFFLIAHAHLMKSNVIVERFHWEPDK